MRKLAHLVRRFMFSIRAVPLTPREQSEVESLLRVDERGLFWDQPFVDQRHGLDGARRVLTERPGNRSLARAALLHDVGKRHARMGTWQRSMASGIGLLHIEPPWWRRYYEHGPIGAEELRAVGAESLVVDWAKAHAERRRPDSIDPADWAILKGSDRA